MVATCANPNCSAIFRYLNRGKLFAFTADRMGASQLEAYWLCESCAPRFSLVREASSGEVRLHSLGRTHPRDVRFRSEAA